MNVQNTDDVRVSIARRSPVNRLSRFCNDYQQGGFAPGFGYRVALFTSEEDYFGCDIRVVADRFGTPLEFDLPELAVAYIRNRIAGDANYYGSKVIAGVVITGAKRLREGSAPCKIILA